MSQRTLLEINHDFDLSEEAREALRLYLASGGSDDAEELQRFGIKVFGRRHHADKFSNETFQRIDAWT